MFSARVALLRAHLTPVVAVIATICLFAAGAVLAPAAQAQAATTTAKATPKTAKAATAPATVTDDALPTVQVNGVVWAQVTVGNTVYATGSFTQTWPAGQSASSSNQTARSNLLAYDITTGALITSFNHTLNQQGLGITASPDGSTVYVVGDFTTVDGKTRNHIAAFDTASGSLLTTFAPSIGGSAHAVTVTNSTVYVGGNFLSAGGVTRTRLAAFSASNGALLSWAPTADDQQVDAIVLSPDGSRVIVGGRFTTMNGQPASGLGAVDATSGALLPFAINSVVQDGGNAKCGITSLTADANYVYGTGFAFGCGNFEGRFAADPNTGSVVWINDCHGDTYDAAPIGAVLYSVGHAHDCSSIGGFPDTNPRTWHRSLAETTAPSTGTNTGPDSYGWNYSGQPDSTQLDWYPSLSTGSYTGQVQAAWSVTGNSKYIALGGEFPSVNGTAQSGLVRFAVSSVAPNKVGPQLVGSNWKLAVTSLSSGTARVTFPSNWDPDNATLTYNVYRDGASAPVYTTTTDSTFWKLPTLGFTDTGLTPGSTHKYKVTATDPNGNSTSSLSVSVTVSSNGSATTSTYAKDVLGDGASDYWRFDEASGTTAYDYAGFDDMTENNGVTQGAPGAVSGDSGTASTFDGSSQFAATSDAIAAPNTFSLEGWFKTTSTGGGMIAGFGNSNTTTSNNYDRHVYMDAAGHVYFGVYNNGIYTINSSNTYNDGQWHYVVAELSGSGAALYLDGKLIGTNSNVTAGAAYNGYWRVGGDNLNAWPGAANAYFGGSIDDVAVYPSALSVAQVRTHFLDAGGTIAGYVPAPSDAYGKAVYGDNPSLYYRLDETTGTTVNDASGNGNPGTYRGTETLGAASPVSGSTGTAATFSGTDGSDVTSNQSQVGPSTYSEELWFKTTTQTGGKLIGFGDQQTGLSSNYDRHVYMTNDGRLVFGVYTGNTVVVSSPKSYNDGTWHYMVATQGASGMKLWVDGVLVGSDPTTSAQGYTGVWRIGGDNLNGWPLQPSSQYFNGTIDEAAVYPTVLSASQIAAHYGASPAGVAPPAPPVAAFTSNASNLAASFDASGSSAPGGTITGYSWDFGDSTTGNGASPNHTYAATGTYTVTLTVTDSNGNTNSVSHQVSVTAPNQPPVAAFTSSCTAASCQFDASGSNDPDGSIASYAWTFGDNSSGSGQSPSHTYAASGTDTVTLTVTDNSGATTSVSHPVTVTVPAPPTVYAADTFARTVASGWGTADTGGAWTASSGSNLSVASGAGSLTMASAGKTSGAYLPSVSSTGTDTTAVVSPTVTVAGGGMYADVIGRRISANTDYRARVHLLSNGTVGISLLAINGGTVTAIKGETIVKGLTYTPGTSLSIRVQVSGSGSTSVQARVWATGSTQPTAWQVSATDTTAALQAKGSVGVSAFLPSAATTAPATLKVSNFSSQPVGN